MNIQVSKRQLWVDAIKIFACILVVLGHFFQSMRASDIIPQNFLINWFNETIYYFHVPLFFICSGYLHQKFSRVSTFGQWKDNFLKKLIALGIPYCVFTLITMVLKIVFSQHVNYATKGILESLFISPISPYWYLYALFFIFIVTPTFTAKKAAVFFLVISIALKAVTFLHFETNLYAIDTVLKNEVWFVLGMCVQMFDVPAKLFAQRKKSVIFAIVLALIFLPISIMLSNYEIANESISFVMGILGCAISILWIYSICNFSVSRFIVEKCAKFTLPVYLMHTIFAAMFRTVLLKLEIYSVWVHILVGITISFAGPIIAALIMERIKILDFLLYPGKYIAFKKVQKE